MSKVFISYRRDDSAFAAYAVYDRLAERLGSESIFIDTNDIPLGVDFWEFIKRELKNCDVLLVFVGQHWLDDCAHGQAATAKRRLYDPEDYVRREIVHCLGRGIPIIPVLCGDEARMPDAGELPEELRTFVRRNGLPLRPGRGVFSQIDDLAKNLQEILLLKEKAAEKEREHAHADPGASERAEPEAPAQSFVTYKTAYICYDAEDRAEVMKRVSLLDVINVKPLMAGADGRDSYSVAEALEKIESADVVYLFWSSAAAKSERIETELRAAVIMDKEIMPILIDLPIPPPPSFLAHVSFEDPLLYLIEAEERRGEKK